MEALLRRMIATARTPNHLVAALNRQMLDEDALLPVNRGARW